MALGNKKNYKIIIKKDGKFHVGYCLEIPQARGQGDTKKEAIEDTKKSIRLCLDYLESQKKKHVAKIVNVSI